MSVLFVQFLSSFTKFVLHLFFGILPHNRKKSTKQNKTNDLTIYSKIIQTTDVNIKLFAYKKLERMQLHIIFTNTINIERKRYVFTCNGQNKSQNKLVSIKIELLVIKTIKLL